MELVKWKATLQACQQHVRERTTDILWSWAILLRTTTTDWPPARQPQEEDAEKYRTTGLVIKCKNQNCPMGWIPSAQGTPLSPIESRSATILCTVEPWSYIFSFARFCPDYCKKNIMTQNVHSKYSSPSSDFSRQQSVVIHSLLLIKLFYYSFIYFKSSSNIKQLSTGSWRLMQAWCWNQKPLKRQN